LIKTGIDVHPLCLRAYDGHGSLARSYVVCLLSIGQFGQDRIVNCGFTGGPRRSRPSDRRPIHAPRNPMGRAPAASVIHQCGTRAVRGFRVS